MGPALDMGRTFIREEYQKSYSALLLLWKGIGQYVVKNMKYRYLFGAVSISKDYQSYSRKLMVSFLEMNHGIPQLSRMIKPRTPFRIIYSRAGIKRVREWSQDIDEISSWVSGIEKDDKGVPAFSGNISNWVEKYYALMLIRISVMSLTDLSLLTCLNQMKKSSQGIWEIPI